MKNGFINTFAFAPDLQVLNPDFCAESVISCVKSTKNFGIALFPRLALVGATAGDLVRSVTIATAVETALKKICIETQSSDVLFAVGLPIYSCAKLYDACAVIYKGKILGVVPAFRPQKAFDAFTGDNVQIEICSQIAPFGRNLVFACDSLRELTVSVAVGDDILGLKSSANIILNPNSVPEICGLGENLEAIIKSESLINHSAVISAFSGMGESSTDGAYAGRRIAYCCGEKLLATSPFASSNAENGRAVADVQYCNFAKLNAGCSAEINSSIVHFSAELKATELNGSMFEKLPFVPKSDKDCEQILQIQAHALAKRLSVTHSSSAVIGVSGGIDSTLALLVAVRATEILNLPKTAVMGITMPCFGTTNRTKDNAISLMSELGISYKTISIKDAVTQHLKDIGHALDEYDVAFENAQARERTQVLMDYANSIGGLVVGTGDLSELALGWATYNGDHMSMYGVNGGVSKTMASYLIKYVGRTCRNPIVAGVLDDILNTDISPELLPPNADGRISQKTEDKVGPYMLHDFFIYYMLGRGYSPKKLLRAATVTFAGVFDDVTIKKWLEKFICRFFSQQFKRNCLPEGPAVTGISLSPRGTFAMPSDTTCAAFLNDLNSEI